MLVRWSSSSKATSRIQCNWFSMSSGRGRGRPLGSAGVGPPSAGDLDGLDGLDGVGEVEAGAGLGGLDDAVSVRPWPRSRDRVRAGTRVQGRAVSWADSAGWKAHRETADRGRVGLIQAGAGTVFEAMEPVRLACTVSCPGCTRCLSRVAAIRFSVRAGDALSARVHKTTLSMEE